MEEQQMTEKISLNLTIEELEIIDKYIELNDDTRQLFDKIRSAYPKSPVEAAYKRVYGWYPPTTPTTPSVSNYEDNRWSAFQSGYSCGYGDGLENSNEISKKPVEKQSKTLTDIVYRWWDDVFTAHSDWDMETSIEDLVDQVEQFLPKQTDVCEEYSYETGRNHVIDVIKRNLR